MYDSQQPAGKTHMITGQRAHLTSWECRANLANSPGIVSNSSGVKTMQLRVLAVRYVV